MFTTLTQKILLGVYVFIVLSIPLGAYLVSQQQIIKSRASQADTKPVVKVTPRPTTSAAKELLSRSQSSLDTSLPNPSPSPAPSSPTIATSFGPTLSVKANLEGRPAGNQATKLFIGIVQGTLTINPKFLLSFSVDLPASGSYGNLSLAGLSPGTSYTALLKGSAQIATASAFIMSPTVSSLNEEQPLNLLTGDLNDDNVINSADFAIIQKAYGSASSAPNWNANADFNKDGAINSFDLAILNKNLGQIGASGVWTSPIPKTSTPSAALSPAIGGPDQAEPGGGYWVWLPE